MTPLLPILLHAGLLVGFWLLLQPGICDELHEENPRHRFLGNVLALIFLANVGLLVVNLRHLLGF